MSTINATLVTKGEKMYYEIDYKNIRIYTTKKKYCKYCKEK